MTDTVQSLTSNSLTGDGPFADRSPHRSYKIIVLAGPAATQAHRKEQFELMRQRNPWDKDFRLPILRNPPSELHIGHRSTAQAIQRRAELVVEALKSDIERDLAQVSQDTPHELTGDLVLVIDGFPNSMIEARLFEQLIGRPDCFLVFTADTEYLKQCLWKQWWAGELRLAALEVSTESYQPQGECTTTVHGLPSADDRTSTHCPSATYDKATEASSSPALSKAHEYIDSLFPEGWHFPYQGLSSWYTTELAARAGTIDLEQGVEAVYVEIAKVLQWLDTDEIY